MNTLARLIYTVLFIPVSLVDIVYWILTGEAYRGLDWMTDKLKELR